MKRIAGLKIATLVSIVLVLAIAPPALQAPTEIPGGAGKYDFSLLRALIRARMAEQRLPSVVVAVAKDGEVVWEEAFGWANRDKMIPATPHTMYSLASISKPITATAVMRLAQEGKIDLDAPINQYLGAAKLRDPEGRPSPATVRQVLGHIAGLPLHYHFFYENEDEPVLSMDEAILRYGISMNPPGEVFQYSNLGYGILDYLVARVSGMAYEDYMRTQIFLPLGLTRTGVGLEGAMAEFAAVRYDSRLRPIPFYDFDHRGGSAVYASAHDLVRFGMFHLKNRLESQDPVLSAASIAAMQQPVPPKVPTEGAYALGWGIRDDDNGYRKVAHTGGMPGVRTVLNLYPSENLAVVVLTNKASEAVTEIADQITATVLPRFGKALQARAKSEEPKPSFRPSGELVGEWSGMVRTWDQTVPLVLTIKPDGDVHVKLGDGLEALLNDVRFKDGNLVGRFVGTIPSPDASRRRHTVLLNVRLRDGRLYGQASAQTTAEPVYFALTSYAELKKDGAAQAAQASE